MGGELESLVRRGFEAFARRDVETMLEFTDPEVEIHLVTNLVAGRTEPYRGHEGVREYLADVDAVWDEVELQPRQFVELSPGRMLVLGRVRSRRGATLTDIPNAWLWEAPNGRVSSIRLFVDSQAVSTLLAERDAPPA